MALKRNGRTCRAVRKRLVCRPFVETYLLLAEALYRDGKSEDAATAINTVRSRANASKMFSPKFPSTPSSTSGQRTFIRRGRWPTSRMGSSLNGGSNEVMKKQLLQNAMYTSDFLLHGYDRMDTLPHPCQVHPDEFRGRPGQNPGWK